ncbi:SOS response-associated peptidase [Sneathiella glossodoripedis]|uniref:SOS response-associated peptidase n=1 Tax=Sneathiella glossodoripedis TaxID=418853 RepID=UPI000470DDE7|nr:SOS response-associated peptidase [Sneathiella glossodoripedis]
MCARFSLTSPIEAIRQIFGFKERPNLPPAYNIAPTNYILALRINIDDGVALSAFQAHWGLIPKWAKDGSVTAKLINARSETVDQKPSFREAFSTRRCIIPANGFFEWRKDLDGEKQPYYFQASDVSLFVFAGLWEKWTSPNGEQIESCTILTEPATEDVAPIHSRKPVTVKVDYIDEWLSGTDRQSIPSISMQERFTFYPVHKKVGNVRENNATY